MLSLQPPRALQWVTWCSSEQLRFIPDSEPRRALREPLPEHLGPVSGVASSGSEVTSVAVARGASTFWGGSPRVRLSAFGILRLTYVDLIRGFASAAKFRSIEHRDTSHVCGCVVCVCMCAGGGHKSCNFWGFQRGCSRTDGCSVPVREPATG